MPSAKNMSKKKMIFGVPIAIISVVAVFWIQGGAYDCPDGYTLCGETERIAVCATECVAYGALVPRSISVTRRGRTQHIMNVGVRGYPPGEGPDVPVLLCSKITGATLEVVPSPGVTLVAITAPRH